MKYYEIEKLYKEDIQKEDLIQFLKDNKDIKEYYLIEHNKDTYEKEIYNENGEILHRKGENKKIHYHLYIGYHDYGRQTIQKVKNDFSLYTENIKAIKKDIESAIRYGIHLGYNEKYQYKKEEYISNDYERIEKAIGEYKNDIEEVLKKFIEHIENNVIETNKDIIYYFASYGQLQYCINHLHNLKDTLTFMHNYIGLDATKHLENERRN